MTKKILFGTEGHPTERWAEVIGCVSHEGEIYVVLELDTGFTTIRVKDLKRPAVPAVTALRKVT